MYDDVSEKLGFAGGGGELPNIGSFPALPAHVTELWTGHGGPHPSLLLEMSGSWARMN